jgi:CHAT domain-containing protein
LYFTQSNWQDAISQYKTAMQAAETSRIWSVNDTERQRILTQALSIYENAIQCAVNLNNYQQAIEFTERIRSRQLVELIASKDLYNDAEVPPEIQQYLAEYQQLNQKIDNLRPGGTEKLATTNTSRNLEQLRKDTDEIAEAEARKQFLYNQIRAYDKVLAGQIAIAPISHSEIQQLIPNDRTAILTFYSTDNDTHIFILKHDREPELFTCIGQGFHKLQNWLIENWFIPYHQRDNNQWQTQMPEVLAEIANRLQLPQLIANHLNDIQELVLVPHLLLHQIPFAAIPINPANELLGEKFTLRFIPSCQILQYCHQRPPIDTNIQGIVEDADDSLMGARYEGHKIAEIYNVRDKDRLRGKTQATIANYRQLLGRVNRLHSSHHASSQLDNPLESCLLLADGKITLGDLLLGERYHNLDEIFLSACETHVGLFNLTDDVATITTGFLCIGARSVQSTLWSVNDLVTAIFDVFYHQERREGYNRVVSLQRAQVRLRYLSGEEFRRNHYPELKRFLDEVLDVELDEIESRIERLNIAKKTATGEEYQEILAELDRLDLRFKSLESLIPTLDTYCTQAYPFAAPYYWAGFICHGMA